MAQQTWLLFAAMVFVMSATPGPNMLLALSHGIRYGFRPTLMTCAGLMFGLGLIMAGSIAGLGAVLAASSLLFSIIKYAGAVYLIYIGVRTWRSAPRAVRTAQAAQDIPVRKEHRFRTGVLVSLSNPKAFIFFMALFPQFIDKSAPQIPQFVILGLTILVIESLWQMIYAGGGARLARWLDGERRQRAMNRITGGIFIGAGVALGLARR